MTGAKGMLGCDVCDVLRNDHDVVACDIEDFDITDAGSTMASIRRASPRAIIHLAAFTDVDACEDEREKAFRVNALGTKNVADSARSTDAYLIYISTDYVFDGTKAEPYVETDKPCPINYYGLTKLYGELYVGDIARHHLIIRTSWLFGPNGKNFIDTILGRASEHKTVQVVDDQKGSPTYTLDLARGIRQAVERGLEGVIHLTNLGETTWFGLARYAASLAGIETDIQPVPSSRYATKAARPSYSVLESAVALAGGITPLPPWQEAVKHHLGRRGVLKGGGVP